MNARSDAKPQAEREPHDPATTPERATATPENGEVEKRDPAGGPATLGWWLDDGPDSPVAADIKEPEKHL